MRKNQLAVRKKNSTLILNFKNTDEYQSLLEDFQSTVVEHEFGSRWLLINGYWQAGKRLREEPLLKRIGTDKLVQALAVDMGRSERTIWYALRFYDTYPKLDKLPEGKGISWNKIITKYLTKPKEKKICQHEWVEVCRKCGVRRKNG